MFGDPYNFLIFSKQEMKITISSDEKINGIAVWFYQRNNFKYKAENGVINELSKPSFGDNIFVTDIQLKMGTDLTKVEEDRVIICSQDNLNYNVDDTEVSNYKTLDLIWYNKDSDGKYIGFGDGRILRDENGNLISYDEIDYIKIKQEDNRLLAEQSKVDTPNDIVGLELSADFTELKELLPKVQKSIFTNLFNELKAFRNSLGNDTDDITKIFLNEWLALPEKNEDGTIKNEGGYFYSKSQLFQDTITNIQNYYSDGLAFAAACDRKKGTLDTNEVSISESGYDKNGNQISVDYNRPTDNLYVFETEMINIIYFFINELKDGLNDVESNISSQFKGIYDAYKIRINSIENTIQSLLDSIINIISYNSKGKSNSILFIDLFDRAVNTYKNDSGLVPWSPSIQDAEYDNLYCIYWYKYNEGYTELDDPFAGINWERVKLDAEGKDVVNIGLPFIDQEYKEDLYPIKLFDNKDKNSTLQIKLDNKNTQEKYKAVLIYNHEVFWSNEVVFTNSRPLVEDKVLNNITIQHSTNSKSFYPLYGVDNELINASDANRSRYIQLRYLNEQNNFDDNKLTDALVYWYIPKNATMLTYRKDDYSGFTIHESAENIDNGMAKQGYTCFYKKISTYENDCYLPYRIKSYFTPSQTNNTIYCVVVKGQLKMEAFISFDFSSFGSNGTDYTLRVRPYDDVGRIINRQDDAKDTFAFEVELYDYNNELIEIKAAENNSNITINLISSQGESKVDQVLFNISNGKIIGTIDFNNTEDYYQLLSVTIDIDVATKITGFYLIPSYLERGYYFEGPSTIIYDSSGGNPVYYKDTCKLFKKNVSDEQVEDIQWSIRYFTNNELIDSSNLSPLLKSYSPTIHQDKLKVSLFYLQGANLRPILIGENKENEVVWAQPLHLMQNRYPSAMLNAWDGSLQIDEKNGTILSSMIGAGRKNDDNTFSGVLMGNITPKAGITIDNLNPQVRTLAHNHTGMGIYGFDSGEQSFGFNINGSAFIGKSGAGRISFDGTHGFIYSQNWLNSFMRDDGSYNNPFYIEEKNGIKKISLNKGSAGMAIDLQSGHIDAYDFKLTSSGIYLNSSPENYSNEEDQYYFKIGNKASYIHYDKQGQLIVNINNAHIQSNQFDLRATINNKPSNDQNTSVILSNLTPFNIDGKDNYFFVGVWDKSGSAKESYIRLANDGTLRIKTPNFSLNKDGDVSIMGNITAKGGKIFNLRADKTFEVQGNNVTRTILLANDPASYGWQSYFYVGNNINYIKYDTNDKLVINATNFKLTANGDVEVKGKITATSGSFEKGCTIGGISVKAKGIGGTGWSLDKDGGIIGGCTINEGSITGSGWSLASSGATFTGGITVDGKIYVADSIYSGSTVTVTNAADGTHGTESYGIYTDNGQKIYLNIRSGPTYQVLKWRDEK